jgi:hypothetical protein
LPIIPLSSYFVGSISPRAPVGIFAAPLPVRWPRRDEQFSAHCAANLSDLAEIPIGTLRGIGEVIYAYLHFLWVRVEAGNLAPASLERSQKYLTVFARQFQHV